MATKPEDRYASAAALADDIERWMADEPVTAWREPLVAAAGGGRIGTARRSSPAGGGAGGRRGRVRSLVLAVQTRAKAAIAANWLARRQRSVGQRRAGAIPGSVQARYDLAVEAIKTFHTGVSEDFLLKQDSSRTCATGC